MRYLYGVSDEKFVNIKLNTKREVINPLSTYKYRSNGLTNGKPLFDKNDIPIIFKCSPDTLLNLCANIVDAIRLPSVFTWDIERICCWLRKYGYPQYQNTFRVNLINGHTLLLLDASALSAINIKDFDHIKDIAYGIRTLFHFEMTKFGRSISLAPEFHYELYKLFRIKTGAKYEDVRRSDLWRRMQLIREKTPNYSHWELLERWLSMVPDPKYNERFGGIHRHNLYKCNAKSADTELDYKDVHQCYCLPPCECYWTEDDIRPPWRFKCLPHLQPDKEFVVTCDGCLPPCSCLWSSKKYMTHEVLSCLKRSFPHKYGAAFTSRRNTLGTRPHSRRISLH